MNSSLADRIRVPLMAIVLVLVGCSPDSESSDLADGQGQTVVTSVQGVDPSVVVGLTPFDHVSSIESYRLNHRKNRVLNLEVAACLDEAGYPNAFDLPPFDPSDPLYNANADFPDLQRLEREGVKLVTVEDEEFARETRVPEDVIVRCGEDDALPAASVELLDLYDATFGAWIAALDGIDAHPSLDGHRSDWRSCLVDAGVPEEATTSPQDFFATLDGQLTHEPDAERRDALARDMGRLYAECGEGWFTAREELRGGEARDAFIREHESQIRSFAELLEELE